MNTSAKSLANLFAYLPANGDASAAETFTELLARPGLRIERIVSTGQASPPGFWFDQPQNEWVVVLQGAAGLSFEDTTDIVTLRPGDFVEIAAHRRHRVEWTALGETTVWLAIHYA
jgi:cupin 2 domain-containing protein